MTVSSQVKGCFASVKSIEASLDTLIHKTQNEEAKKAFKDAQAMVNTVQADLETQVLYLTKEEPQYKS
ncbi:DUF1657 domain-containing protein [Barrientosiimonas marina]|uniref:DUF1657 domain-containing protein n=1 Tax=Lentibacillus kimchii TaxID=1542911 RepID=A0ABW2UNZ3_9BACI